MFRQNLLHCLRGNLAEGGQHQGQTLYTDGGRERNCLTAETKCNYFLENNWRNSNWSNFGLFFVSIDCNWFFSGLRGRLEQCSKSVRAPSSSLLPAPGTSTPSTTRLFRKVNSFQEISYLCLLSCISYIFRREGEEGHCIDFKVPPYE